MSKDKFKKMLNTDIALRLEKLKGFYQVLEHLTEEERGKINEEIIDTYYELDYLKQALQDL